MLVSPDRRVVLADPLPVPPQPELEAVFVGAAPALVSGTAASAALDATMQLGFAPADDLLTGIPLAIGSTATFLAIFPNDSSWLANAVADYFAAGGKRAWVVRMVTDPSSPLDAYAPAGVPRGATPAPANGIEIAMQVPSAGLVLFPDLEALCLSASLPPPPVPAPAAAPPSFQPLAIRLAVAAAGAPLPPAPPASVTPNAALSRISAALAAQRPDMLCLFALPVGADRRLSTTAIVRRAPEQLYGSADSASDLPQVQAFAPLLANADGNPTSASGLVAGALAAMAETDGLWRSAGGRSLPLGRVPVRRIESNALDTLRRAGIAVLRSGTDGTTTIDSDILACHETGGNASRRDGGTRRLMGWLLRSLEELGDQLVFENVLDDGRVELILNDFFATLLRRGALSGRQIADAATVTRNATPEGVLSFDIRVATATAMQRILLRFLDGRLSATLGMAA